MDEVFGDDVIPVVLAALVPNVVDALVVPEAALQDAESNAAGEHAHAQTELGREKGGRETASSRGKAGGDARDAGAVCTHARGRRRGLRPHRSARGGGVRPSIAIGGAGGLK